MEPPAAVSALFAAAHISGRSLQSFPADFASGILADKVTLDVLQRFLALETHPLAQLVWGIPGFRSRLLADPSFPIKVAIEVGIGIVTKITAERTRRGSSFWAEIDFVAANVVMAIIADFMLTWLPAPTLSYTTQADSWSSHLGVSSYCASCPENAFQRVQPGMDPFSTSQRFGAIMCNGLTLLCVGFLASVLGVGLTNLLVAMRKQFSTMGAQAASLKGAVVTVAGQPPPQVAWNRQQQVLKTSALYGLYMATSSNLRYQIIAGIIEERGIEVAFRGHHEVCAALSFIVRTANTFLGSVLWVDFVRLMGMQTSPAPVKVEVLDEESPLLMSPCSSSEWKTKTP